ncbi:hypothetical protein GCM10011349_47060 [Novosphingobium indicum]|uniref:ABC transporter domain-containing protein n=1 Tax=Novosphingobium indicum TaxID=462949 RepID=A0ABQ2K5J9_9SPHN|nr:ATP-binding cassette domain-containing protein [Novosphingobium indicum]GGN62925.1 hypothetical protein GCM10011349_47060 [Novosphingobium indicum]
MIVPAENMLRLEELSILRRDEPPLVEGLSIAVGAGEILAIVGRSGIGKSSILNVVAGFVTQQGRPNASPWHWFWRKDDLQYQGSVFVNGATIDGSPPELRKPIGMVMQGGVVYEHMSVLENVTFPLRAAGLRDAQKLREEALRLLHEVELFDDLKGKALDQHLTGKARSLSGGERQRLALARALAKNPSVFLLDEAFANLDPVLRGDLFDRFTRLIVGQSRCAMVVTHDLSDLAKVQRVLLLGPGDDGPGYCSYRRESSNVFTIESSCGDGSDYWQTWHHRICAAAAE